MPVNTPAVRRRVGTETLPQQVDDLAARVHRLQLAVIGLLVALTALVAASVLMAA